MHYNDYTQINDETGFERKINITCVPSTQLPRTMWVHLVASEHWAILDLFAQRAMTETYNDYHDHGRAPSRRLANVAVCKRQFQFDVQAMRLIAQDGREGPIPVALVGN